MPILYTSGYDLKLLGLNPQLRHVYIDNQESKGGEPALVKVRNLEGSLPLTLRENYTESGYLTSVTEFVSKTSSSRSTNTYAGGRLYVFRRFS